MGAPDSAIMTCMNPQPELVLFDLDDTLCDYGGARVGRLRIAFGLAEETAGKPFDAPIDDAGDRIHPHPAAWRRSLSRPAGRLRHRRSGGGRALPPAGTSTNRFHGLQLYPDAIETLHRSSVRSSRTGGSA